MRVLVTGALGFVPINVVRHLAAQGDTVVGLYRSAPDRVALDFLADVQQRVELVPGDIDDADRLAALIAGQRIDAIIHAAAVTPLPEIERQRPAQVMQTNLMGTVNVLEAARAAGIRRVVYVSSDGIYGAIQNPGQVITEETVPQGDGLYAIAKVASEGVCRRYQALFGMEIPSGRVCATYGPMERPTRARLGMSSVYEIAHAVLAGKVLRVRGLPVARTWTHVDDIALGLIAMLKAPRPSYPAYNLSYGRNYTLQEVLDAFVASEPAMRYVVVSEDEPADIALDVKKQRGVLDVTRLKQDLGYQPRYDLVSGIRAYMGWLRAQK